MSASTKYDALVVGSGIGGMESALKLGDMGYKVLVVEKQPSVGGKMILLSKVFPTLDCASCISTPKMGATIHHPNIDVLTYAEVEGIRGDGDGRYQATVHQNPKFVEDIVRDVAQGLLADANITWFSVSAENFESIHNHSAYAHISSSAQVPG